jgi:pilus assembly protein CpaE
MTTTLTSRIRALVVIEGSVDRRLLASALPTDADVDVTGFLDDFDSAVATLEDSPSDILVVACAGYSERALFLIETALRDNADRPVVVLTEGSPNGYLRRLFEAGADDVVVLPDTAERVAFALQKAVARKRGGTTAASTAFCPMICVLGPKGGTGKTLTSANLGVGLASAGQRVVVVDLDLQFGDVGLALGLSPERTIHDLARSGGALDAGKVESFLVEHPSGLRVLLAPTRPDHAGAVTTEFLREVYAILRASNDFVIVDTPPGFVPEVIASVDSSSDICIVAMLDSLSLKNTKLGLETLDLMGYDRSRIKLLLNRADSNVGIASSDVVAVLGRTPDISVPSDRDIPRAVNEGTPIVLSKAKSEAAQAFRALTDMYLAGAGKPTRSAGRPVVPAASEPSLTADLAPRRRLFRRRSV